MRIRLAIFALCLLLASPARAQFATTDEQSLRNGAVVAPKFQGFGYAGQPSWLTITSTNIAKNEIITDLSSLESAYSTTVLGRLAAQQLNNEADSVYIGNEAGQFMTSQGYYEKGNFASVGNGFHNVAIGPYAMGEASITGCSADSGAGSFVVAVGAYSLYQLGCAGSGFDTTAVGDHSGANVTTGTGETIIGGDTAGPTTGNFNTIVGYNASGFSWGAAHDNVVLGHAVASTTLTTGGFNILIGTNAGVDTPASSTSDYLDIGNLIYGTSLGTSATTPAGLIGISTASPLATLDVNGGAYCRVTVGGTQSAGGTYTPNFQTSCSVTLTFGAGNLTIANPTNLTAGHTYQIALTQDATGSRTVTWGGDFKWAGGTAPTLSTAAADTDIISCWASTATTLDCTLVGLNFH